MTVGTHKKIFNFDFVRLGLHGLYRGLISDNGTSNAQKSLLTTELTTLGHIFGISGQNYIGIHLKLKKKYFVSLRLTP